MTSVIQDIRFALRQLVKSPGFTSVAVATLALGIGANTAIFSVVDGVLLQPLNFPGEQRLVRITDAYPQGALVAMRTKFQTMDVAGYRDGEELNLAGVGEPVRLQGSSVSANFFSLLGVPPSLGRVFVNGEDQPGKDNLVILSQALWRQRFGGDLNVIGRSVSLDGVDREIVGVMPAGFQLGSAKPQFWVPLDLDSRKLGAYWGGGWMAVIARLRPGVTLEQANAELYAYLPHLRQMFPWRMPDSLWAASSVTALHDSLVGEVRKKLLILLGAISLVLLIACANVVNLLLARAAARRREMAVRAALGAARWRMFRQLLTECILLGIGGGAVGLLLAIEGVLFLKAILPADTPRLAAVAIDWRVIAFTAAVAIFTGIVFGTAPALRTSKVDLTRWLREGSQHSSPGSQGVRSALATSEISLAAILVIGAGLTVRSLWELLRVEPGFRTESVLTARITPNERFCQDFARCQMFYKGLLEHLRAAPGVKASAIVNVVPLSGRINAFAAAVEDHPRDPKDPALVMFKSVISPDYFSALGIPLLQGRGFSSADMTPNAALVALITASTARKFWPHEDPVGKHMKPVWDKNWITIVGVVGDVNEYSLASRLPDFADGAIYVPYGNGAQGRVLPTDMAVVVRTATDPGSFTKVLRGIVSRLSPEVPVSEVETLRTIAWQSLETPRSTMTLLAAFAALALLLGSVGVYGVISYGVTRRVPEIGVRMALGAGRRNVIWLVMRQGTRLVLTGLVIGIGGALLASRILSSLLFAVTTSDPATYVLVSIFLSIVALAACYIPARRATKVDPVAVLRYE